MIEKWVRHLPETAVRNRREYIRSYFCGSREEQEKEVWRSLSEQWRKVFLAACVFLGVIFLAAGSEWLGAKDISIHRDRDGEELNRELNIDTGKEKESYDLIIHPKAYTEKEERKAFDKAKSYLKKHTKGDNPSLNEVKGRLHFPEQIPGNQVKISWDTGDLSLIDEAGNVFNEDLKEPVIIKVNTSLSYGEHREMIMTPVRLVPGQADKKGTKIDGIKKKLEQIEKENAGKDTFRIPSSINGSEITEADKGNGRLPALAAIGILCLVLLWYTEEERQKQKKAKAMKETMEEYPMIISRFVLLLGAGMTIQGAVHSIGSSFDRDHPKFVYRQFQQADKKIALGMSQAQALRELGSSIQLPCYKKLSVLLSQSLLRGTRDLLSRLEEEETEAFSERKETARRKGEEASTKLLMPMILMLIVILTLLMVPAFLSFS